MEATARGSTQSTRQDGEFLAHRNVVVVSMNYRLGALGCFVHPSWPPRVLHHAAGNYGLMDQTAAIRWVKDNISVLEATFEHYDLRESADRRLPSVTDGFTAFARSVSEGDR